MKFYNKHNKKYDWKNRKLKITILVSSIVVGIVVGGTLLTQKFSKNKEVLKAVASDSSPTQNQDNKTEKNYGPIDKSSDNEVENVEYLEKYIAEQEKGQKPEGADGKKVAYLTFDDGPSETVTPQILDILKSENVHATFFLVGKNMDKNEASKNLVKREVEEGNAIGIHSYSHDYNYLFPKEKINIENCMTDFNKTDDSLKKILGEKFSTRALRFPGGQETWSKKDPQGADSVDKALHEKDWHQIDWNCLSGDAEGKVKNAGELTEYAIKTIGKREKALVLMHDTYGKEETAKALPGIIQYLKQQGYEFKIIK
ncbi:polysaccharide deacetylase [Clostridium sp. SHJSY1]|uniref:polysaccharide deacetylase family protein n=1 Tax=Clostridium sp. SHJSY1 TaxID=2942483 RepID=UPI00287412E3|nr:polysaccharide deacetylase family protein [Clostridium sp. SHJSY1]MDS0525547.1 polysaccharide deacetylase [Clostridium sp. SHJSY1]